MGKKVPNSHRIERLIHLELRDDKSDNPEIECKACGKTHKEWFWVDASREGLRGVDEVVKKWIEYGERSAMVTGQVATTPGKSSAGTTPKKSKVDAVTPTPVQKRPTLKDAQVGGAQGGKTPPRGKSGKTLSPSSAGGKRASASPARSSRSAGGSRPGSSAGKGKGKGSRPSSSAGKKGKGGGGWKNYDENEGSEEYRPE